MDGAKPPAGFIEFSHTGAHVVCISALVDELRAALEYGTLYDYAADHQDCDPLMGRGFAYVTLFGRPPERVVVRHNQHGGAFASFTRDWFLPPTRAPYELSASIRLKSIGIPTPDILGYATYRAGVGPLRRVDVLSRVIAKSVDLSDFIADDDSAARSRGLAAAAPLLAAVSRAGVRHHDFNVKNVLLRDTGSNLDPLLLDVDRVTFDNSPTEAFEQNLARILRSAQKWKTRYRAPVSDAELGAFERAARDAFAVSPNTLS